VPARRPPGGFGRYKKKETLGKKANVGQEYRPKGEPLEVDTHDFPDKELGKAIPYGVYDMKSNEAWVSVGISRDTAEFAVEAIRRWWHRMGKKRYKKPKRLLITADSDRPMKVDTGKSI
jgi:hypothetical protein